MSDRDWQVVFTATATAHVETIQAWWQEERAASSMLFVDELSDSVDRLRRLPQTGAHYSSTAVPNLRRVALTRSRYHLYYTVHSERSEVIIRAVWHSARGSGPQLK